MKVYLKVKIKSLAAEAQMIRLEERKIKKIPNWQGKPLLWAAFWGLRGHRRFEVRDEARAALLAYGMIRGKAYSQLESPKSSPPDWKRVQELIKKYGTNADLERFLQWRPAAKQAA